MSGHFEEFTLLGVLFLCLFYAWGLTELTVNSCFFDTPPRAYLIII